MLQTPRSVAGGERILLSVVISVWVGSWVRSIFSNPIVPEARRLSVSENSDSSIERKL